VRTKRSGRVLGSSAGQVNLISPLLASPCTSLLKSIALITARQMTFYAHFLFALAGSIETTDTQMAGQVIKSGRSRVDDEWLSAFMKKTNAGGFFW